MVARQVSITVESRGLESMIDALREIGRPSFRLTGDLEKVLLRAFAHTQAQVHVITGRLKASGHTESDFDGNSWTGQIHYGGNEGTPAYYGIYEQRRGGTRPDGTPHDFYTGLEQFDGDFEDAIDRWMEVLR